MPRVNRVKNARALYHTKPDIDPATGEQKVVPVFQRDGVTPKTDKHGRQITRRLTVRDLDRPKPNLRCDFPGCGIDNGEITPGSAYKFLSLRFEQKNRHAVHPDWQHWEYSSSVAAQCARLQADMHETIDGHEFTDEGDFDSLRDELKSEASSFLDERQESLDNMPEQLQDGSQAYENVDMAQEWVDAISNADSPITDFGGECSECEGTGKVLVNVGAEDEDEEDCEECDGSGEVEGPTEDWIEEARQALHDAVDEAQF